MHKRLKFRLLAMLFTLAVTQSTVFSQVIIPVQDPATDLATSYYNGGNFQTGDQITEVLLGNINHNPGRQLGLVKYDISEFEGQTATSVVLNIRVLAVYDDGSDNYLTQTVGIYLFNNEFGAEAFTPDDATSTNVTFSTSLALTGTEFIASFDLTDAFTTAQANGFDYLAFQMVNETVLADPSGQYVYVYAAFPSLAVTVVPEPSTYAMLGLALFMITGIAKRRASIIVR